MAAPIGADGNIGGGGIGRLVICTNKGSASLYPVILPLELAALAGE